MKNTKISLQDIKLLRSEVRDHPFVFSEEFDGENVQRGKEISFRYSDNYLQNFMHFKFDIEIHGRPFSLGHFDIIYTFEVDNLQDILTDEEAKKTLHLNIISISYSTSRGVLFGETKGFALNEIYLDPISPLKLYESFLHEIPQNEELV